MTFCLGRSRRRSRTLSTTVAAILLVSCRKAAVCLSSTPLLHHRQQQQRHLPSFLRRSLNTPNKNCNIRSKHDNTRSILSHLRAGQSFSSSASSDHNYDSQTTTPGMTIQMEHDPEDSMSSTPSTASHDKLVALRASLQEQQLDAYLVPSDDPHLSEYTPDAYKRRAFLTNFQGSAGTAVVTKSAALLWTDSRYVPCRM